MKKTTYALLAAAALLLAGCTNNLPLQAPPAYDADRDYFLVDNCENSKNVNYLGGLWYANVDTYGQSFSIPQITDDKRFYMTQGGSPESPGHSARVVGYIGPNTTGDEYTNGGMVINLSAGRSVYTMKPFDASNFTGIRFYCRMGDVAVKEGKVQNRGLLMLMRRSRTEGVSGAEFQYIVPQLSANEWTLIKIPLNLFKQGSWVTPERQRDAEPFNDILAVYFFADTEFARDCNFDIAIDDVGFY